MKCERKCSVCTAVTEEDERKCPVFRPSAALAGYDFEMNSKSPEQGGTTLCGRLGRKHRMKRMGSLKTACVYPGCDAVC